MTASLTWEATQDIFPEALLEIEPSSSPEKRFSHSDQYLENQTYITKALKKHSKIKLRSYQVVTSMKSLSKFVEEPII